MGVWGAKEERGDGELVLVVGVGVGGVEGGGWWAGELSLSLSSLRLWCWG